MARTKPRAIAVSTTATDFESLKFESHLNWDNHIHARADFPNGYGVSVVGRTGRRGGTAGFSGAYCDLNSYEVAVFHNGHLTYDTPLTDDVLAYESKERVTEIMHEVAALPRVEA